MFLRFAALVLVCHTFGQCCYPDVMSGRFAVRNRNYYFAINYTAGIAVSSASKASGYFVHFFPHGFYYSYDPKHDICRKNDVKSYHQTTPAPIPDDAKKVSESPDTVTYSYTVNGRTDQITVTKSTPCHPVSAIYTYSEFPGSSNARFYDVKNSIDTGFFNKFLTDCAELHSHFNEFIIG